MNIFQSIKAIFNALSDNYQSSREIAQRVNKQQESMLNEAKCKVLLENQLKAYIEYLRSDSSILALWIDIADECLPFVDEVAYKLRFECSLTQGSEVGRYLLQLIEEEL
jgi:hypothetical protein